MGALVVNSIKRNINGLIHQCPYEGMVNFTNVNINDFMSSALPQIIPTGTYKVVLRLHTSANITFSRFEFVGVGDAVDVMKRMQIG